jgi:hypothetical protein
MAEANGYMRQHTALQPAIANTKQLIVEATERATYYEALSGEGTLAGLIAQMRQERQDGRPASVAQHVKAGFARSQAANQMRLRMRRAIQLSLTAVCFLAILYACTIGPG